MFLGCAEQFHITANPVCLAHMIEIRATYFDDRDGRDLWCAECYRGSGYGGKLVTVSAMLITDLTGITTEEHARETGETWTAGTAPRK